jgi:hypothetical protein
LSRLLVVPLGLLEDVADGGIAKAKRRMIHRPV